MFCNFVSQVKEHLWIYQAALLRRHTGALCALPLLPLLFMSSC